MNPGVWALLVGTVTAIAGVLVALIGKRQASSVDKGSAMQNALNSGFVALTGEQVKELARLRVDIDHQSGEITELKGQVQRLQEWKSTFHKVARRLVDHIHRLREVIRDLGGDPPDDPYTPAELRDLLGPDD